MCKRLFYHVAFIISIGIDLHYTSGQTLYVTTDGKSSYPLKRRFSLYSLLFDHYVSYLAQYVKENVKELKEELVILTKTQHKDWTARGKIKTYCTGPFCKPSTQS